MAEAALIPEELKKLIGVEDEPEVNEVEKGDIKRFAQAIGDSNPLWQDEEYARKSRYGKIVAPPTFLNIYGAYKHTDNYVRIGQFKRIVLGSNEFEFYKPIMAGDVITSVPKLSDIQEKQTKSGGTILLLISDLTFTNQRGELVARGRYTFINRY